MYFSQLNECEKQVVLDCMTAILKSGELEFEFQTRLGIDEEELKKVIAKFPDIDDSIEDSNETLAINNCLNEICHGIKFTKDKWEKYFYYDIDKIREVYKKWAKLRGWTRTGVK
jgi:hypothetical protein